MQEKKLQAQVHNYVDGFYIEFLFGEYDQAIMDALRLYAVLTDIRADKSICFEFELTDYEDVVAALILFSVDVVPASNDMETRLHDLEKQVKELKAMFIVFTQTSKKS